MMKRKLKLFISTMCLLAVITSCGKDKEEVDQRLANKENKEAGELFLEKNAGEQGVLQTSKGLQYKKVVDNKDSKIKPYLEDTVNVTYTGKMIDDKIFVSATDEDLLLVTQIEGFQDGLQLMTEGSTYIFYIPYCLAYSASSKTVSYDGKAVTVKPYSALIFEVTLNSVKRKTWD